MLLYGKLRYHVFTLSMNTEDYHPQHAGTQSALRICIAKYLDPHRPVT